MLSVAPLGLHGSFVAPRPQHASPQVDPLELPAPLPPLGLAADQLWFKIEQLGAESDLAKKFRDIFEGSFADALLSIETRAKSIKDTVKDLAKSLETQLLSIANKNIAEQLFGKSGALGGVPDFFAKMFGGKGLLGGAGDAAGATGVTALGTAAAATAASMTIVDTAAISLAAALEAAAVAASSSSVGSAAKGLAGLFPAFDSGFGPFAAGGDPPIGKLALVGERGPELIMPRSAMTVIPNDVLTARRGAKHTTINAPITINLQGKVDTRSAEQIGRAAYIEMTRAVSRS